MNTYIMIILILLLTIAVLALFYSILKLNREINENTNNSIEKILDKDDSNVYTQKTETTTYYDIGDRMAALNKDKEVKKEYIKIVCNNCNKETSKDNIIKCDKCGKECCIYCSEEEVTLDLDKNSTRSINICKECSEE